MLKVTEFHNLKLLNLRLAKILTLLMRLATIVDHWADCGRRL